jgi:hypothetical protein
VTYGQRVREVWKGSKADLHQQAAGSVMNTHDKARRNFDALFKEPLPVEQQADPLRPEIILAEDFLDVPEYKRTIKNTVSPRGKSRREVAGLSHRDIVAILEKIEQLRLAKREEPLLSKRDMDGYRAYAAGNSTIEDLAAKNHMSASALKVFFMEMEEIILDEITDLNRRGVKIIGEIIHQPDEAEPADEGADQNAAIVAEVQTNDERDARLSGGESVGGRIIIRGHDSKGNLLALDTLDRSGTLRTTHEKPGDEGSNTSQEVDHDDYSEESGA